MATSSARNSFNSTGTDYVLTTSIPINTKILQQPIQPTLQPPLPPLDPIQKMQPQNEFRVQAQNQQKIEQSIRLMQYINMYNLKRDQIIYQCPIYLDSIHDEDFQIGVDCLQEMSDLFIVYNRERKMEFSRIRDQERIMAEKLREEEAKKKSTGFFSNLFKSKSKDKRQPEKSPSKLTINESMMKSSVYVAKITDEDAIIKSRLKKDPDPQPQPKSQLQPQPQPKPEPEPIAIPSVTKPANNSPPPHPPAITKKQSKKEMSEQIDNLAQKEQGNIFDQSQLLQIDENDLLSLNESKDCKAMSEIKEDQQENSVSIRDSKVSRVSIQDLEVKDKDNSFRGRLSKRSRRNQSEEEDNQAHVLEKSQKKQSGFKKDKKEKKSPQQKTSPKLKNKPSLKQKSSKKQSEKAIKIAQNQQQKPSDNIHKKEDRVSSYIEREISRLSAISNRQDEHDSETYSLLSSADVMSQPSKEKTQIIQPQNETINDSFSDIKIDWFAKIEACELQQRLLMNRFEQRWNQPLKTVAKIKNLRLADFTQELANNPKYRWTRPNLNFGKIIQ